MALDDSDREEIAKLIKDELQAVVGDLMRPGIEVRRAGIPLAGLGGSAEIAALRPSAKPQASENCCNGCD